MNSLHIKSLNNLLLSESMYGVSEVVRELNLRSAHLSKPELGGSLFSTEFFLSNIPSIGDTVYVLWYSYNESNLSGTEHGKYKILFVFTDSSVAKSQLNAWEANIEKYAVSPNSVITNATMFLSTLQVNP